MAQVDLLDLLDRARVIRQRFEQSLDTIRARVYEKERQNIQEKFNVFNPTIFISYAWEFDGVNENKKWVHEILAKDLNRIGFKVSYDREGFLMGLTRVEYDKKVKTSTYVVVVCTPVYLQRCGNANTGVGAELVNIAHRLHELDVKGTVFPIFRKGYFQECVPNVLQELIAYPANDDKYYDSFFTLSQSLFLFTSLNEQPIKSIWDEFLQPRSNNVVSAVHHKFEYSLDQIRIQAYEKIRPDIQKKYNVFQPTIFISYAWESGVNEWVERTLSKDLIKIGFNVLFDRDRLMAAGAITDFEKEIRRATYIVVVCTPRYKQRYTDYANGQDSGVGREMKRIEDRLKANDLKGTVYTIIRGGNFDACVPDVLKMFIALDATDDQKYYKSFFEFSQSLLLFDISNAEPINSIREDFLRQIS